MPGIELFRAFSPCNRSLKSVGVVGFEVGGITIRSD